MYHTQKKKGKKKEEKTANPAAFYINKES